MTAPASVAQLVSTKPARQLWRREQDTTVVQARLTEEEIRDALCVYSPAIVKEIYETTIRQLQNETAKQARLDSKATSLLTAVGLALTVAFTFGCGVLIAQADKWPVVSRTQSLAVGISFWATVIFGLIAGIFAIAALLVRGDYRMINEKALFDKEVLQEYDQRDENDEGITEYRKYLIPHLWTIGQSHCVVHERKARLIQKGQVFFAAFLACLMLIVASVSWTVVHGPQATGASHTVRTP